MVDEPTYEYVKGVGWVPSFVEFASRVIGKFRVTLYKRIPEHGEQGITRDSTGPIENEFRFLGTIYHNMGWCCTDRNFEVTRNGSTDRWLTIKVEVV